MSYGRVWIGAVLPAASGAGIDVGDIYVVNTATPEVWVNRVDLLGTRSWAQIDAAPPAATSVPSSFLPPFTVTQGAPGSFVVTLSAGVADQNGTAMPGVDVSFFLNGAATNLASVVPVDGTVRATVVLGPTTTLVVARTGALGLVTLTVTWTAAEAGQQVATCGWGASEEQSVAYP